MTMTFNRNTGVDAEYVSCGQSPSQNSRSGGYEVKKLSSASKQKDTNLQMHRESPTQEKVVVTLSLEERMEGLQPSVIMPAWVMPLSSISDLGSTLGIKIKGNK